MKGIRARNRVLRHESGASAVEFVLVVPILLLLVAGIINFGAVFGQQLALNHAVREGARAAVVVSSGDGANVQDLVRSAFSWGGDSSSLTATTTGSCGDGDGSDLAVEAAFPARVPFPLPVPGIPDTFNLQADTVFRCEW